MHDTLDYMAQDPVHRKYHHNKITFGMMYAYTENFFLPLSHDEVVHGKGSLLSRMPGDRWQKFANLRACYGMMWGYPRQEAAVHGRRVCPGTGMEFCPEPGFSPGARSHACRHAFMLVRDLNQLYRSHAALHARDCEPEGFRWVVTDDAENSVYAWLRLAPNAKPIAVVCNFTPVPRHGYRLGLPQAGVWREILNSDAAASYGGSNMGNAGAVQAVAHGAHGQPASCDLTLPPLATIYLEWDGEILSS